MRGRGIHWALFALMFFAGTYVHQKQFNAATPVSRLDLLHALWTRGTVSIDAYHGNTPDKAIFEGHYYSDKAPGTAALALVPFACTATVLSVLGLDIESPTGWLASSWAACAGSIGIVTALGGVALFSWLSTHVPSRSALIATLAIFLGAAPLPYATMMFSHALVAGLLAIAIWAIGRESIRRDDVPGRAKGGISIFNHDAPGGDTGPTMSQDRETVGRVSLHGAAAQEPLASGLPGLEPARKTPCRPILRTWVMSNRWSLIAGFACGWALASEYSSGLVVMGLFLWLGSLGVRKLPIYCMAAAGPLLLIPAYSWACFGDPFTLPYSYQASFPAMSEGLYAIKLPDGETALKLVFSPARGLLFWSPFFAMAVVGYWQLMRKPNRLFWLAYAVPLVHLIVISGRMWDWPGGGAWGPRLLTPMIPLLALPCAVGISRYPKLGLLLAVYSVGATTVATLTDACPGYPTYLNPLMELNIPLVFEGKFSPNLGMMLGLSPYVSVGMYYLILTGGIAWIWRRLPIQNPGSQPRMNSNERE